MSLVSAGDDDGIASILISDLRDHIAAIFRALTIEGYPPRQSRLGLGNVIADRERNATVQRRVFLFLFASRLGLSAAAASCPMNFFISATQPQMAGSNKN